ncbi:four helix bundle protein [Candidatus Saccharibacteria bacterium]|nr:MAG: four helix bundle protein [Candidatus Saccharibacteria bacterium]
MGQRYYDLEERFTMFGVSTLAHFRTYKDPIFSKPIEQVVKSSTIIELTTSRQTTPLPRQTFAIKVFIAKEASETRYWFNFFQRSGDKSQILVELQDEIQQIIMILQKIINTLKNSSENGL